METSYNILVIDDDAYMRDACHQTLTKHGHSVSLANSGREGLFLLEKWSFDLILLDLKMPGEDGLFVLAKIKDLDPETIVVMITGYGSIETAVQAIKHGAFDFIAKPFTPEELLKLVDRVLRNRQLTIENLYLKQSLEQETPRTEIISKSPAMEKVKEMIAMVAPTDSTVLLQGETGTGKGVVARKIHEMSKRRGHSFISVDCGSLVSTIFESELFGYVKGAFTGADKTQYGKFEMAHGGTLFFDEISNIGLEIQAKLLKAVEEKCISKVGDHKVVKVDVRVISATNRNLQKAIAEGLFREDLFFRLNVVSMHLPPLRERKEDIPLLVNHFLNRFSMRQGKAVKGLSPNAMKTLTEYHWPGNVRELENTVERLVVFARDKTITTQDLVYSNTVLSSVLMREPLRLEEMERLHIMKILHRTEGNKTHAARLLGIDRKTLRVKMKKYQIPTASP
ncbi:MAG: sigma-54-dependent Fis family transcriptional regulator [Deltaproteobacteria bacterium]|nr:sigma-54-dependent Fis family transcriptional regulator [Deltaproteobacteria bacterium]MBW2019493.1 sigma-54-dependent Fis family transcriptional regulator [Deltaproteobacteria bacterium]MBW2074330.1 sigma-54-dependent Fis family transcriptional regulator [Deltaproteobacteria bacterium]RLB82136.1 MAG: sigma-54-dependent Fis family transcriptional regulator [Deltaproteobacteria bacterium]